MDFIPGKKLSGLLFEQAVRPLLAEHFPNLVYSAARLDRGSEVIGFDTAMSMDHGWGPKLTLFLNEDDYAGMPVKLDEFFANHLPFEIAGIPTNFGQPEIDGGIITAKNEYPIRHMVTFTTPERFFAAGLGIDIHKPLTPEIWLTITQQNLLLIRSGQVYYDGLGTLEALRARFDWYPEDIWRYLLANQWQRIDQDMPFIGRTGVAGDELGSRLLGARLITDLMNLAFLMEKQYAPYRKWFGTAFSHLNLAAKLTPCFRAIWDSPDWKTRETYLSEAFTYTIEAHNHLSLTEEIPVRMQYFYDRPFLVPPARKIIDALLDGITDLAVRAVPALLGSVNQIADNTDLIDDVDYCRKLRVLYQK